MITDKVLPAKKPRHKRKELPPCSSVTVLPAIFNSWPAHTDYAETTTEPLDRTSTGSMVHNE